MDVIKKLMSADGHMVSDGVYYVRERKPGLMFWDGSYAIRDLAKEFNAGRPVRLDVVRT
jgi:hypothetical protein